MPSNQLPSSNESGQTWSNTAESGKERRSIVMATLWTRLSDAYGGTFTRQFGERPSEMWEMAMADIAPEQIKRGLTKMVSLPKFRTFPPNPMEFRDLCQGDSEDLGLPSEADAFRLALNWENLPARQKHPAVLAALRMLDSWQFRRMTDDQARKHWSSAWSRVVERVRAEGDGWLPDQPLDELPPGASRSPEQIKRGREFLAEIMEGLSMSSGRKFNHQASPEFLRAIGKGE